jgi:hypothetical protein
VLSAQPLAEYHPLMAAFLRAAFAHAEGHNTRPHVTPTYLRRAVFALIPAHRGGYMCIPASYPL